MVNRAGNFRIFDTYYDFSYPISGRERDFRLYGDNRGNFYMVPFGSNCSPVDILLAGVCKGQLEANMISRKLSDIGLDEKNFGRAVQEKILREYPELLRAWTQEYNKQFGQKESLTNIQGKVVTCEGVNSVNRAEMTDYLIENRRMIPAIRKSADVSGQVSQFNQVGQVSKLYP
ncbi:MAG: hypothetical protein LBN07_01305 [Christensenellaceae bacterium]|jgi:hypothetical protein|nr:hypothetical protein [Christensenellaceae bacterium]